MDARFPMDEPIPVPAVAGREAHEAVRRAADRLLACAAESEPSWSAPPVDPKLLARCLGIPIHFTRELRDADAIVVPTRDGFRILANANVRHLGRLNFTLAHEIAHTLFEGAEVRAHLRTRDKRAYERSPEGAAVENLCDRAAADLLMPMPMIVETLRETGFEAWAVPRIVERFEVSLEAAALRLVESQGDRPCAAGFFHHASRPTHDRRTGESENGWAYRVRRLFRSPGFPFVLPTGKSVPASSLIYRASLRNECLSGRETFVLGKTAATLRVSAVALARANGGGEPPMVCAVFSADSARSGPRRNSS